MKKSQYNYPPTVPSFLQSAEFFKKLLPLILLVSTASFVSAETKAVPPSEVFLFKEGKTEGRLFLPKECGRPVLLAAEELQSYWRNITGTELPLAYRQVEARHR